jgi:hypothetical protein
VGLRGGNTSDLHSCPSAELVGARHSRHRALPAGAVAVPASRPAARSTLTFLQLLLGPSNSAFSGHRLLRILDPADELIAGQRSDVLPSIECRGVGDQCLAQVCGKFVHRPTGHSVAAHSKQGSGPDRALSPSHRPGPHHRHFFVTSRPLARDEIPRSDVDTLSAVAWGEGLAPI